MRLGADRCDAELRRWRRDRASRCGVSVVDIAYGRSPDASSHGVEGPGFRAIEEYRQHAGGVYTKLCWCAELLLVPDPVSFMRALRTELPEHGKWRLVGRCRLEAEINSCVNISYKEQRHRAVFYLVGRCRLEAEIGLIPTWMTMICPWGGRYELNCQNTANEDYEHMTCARSSDSLHNNTRLPRSTKYSALCCTFVLVNG